jgi:hypothetical protein
MNKHLSVISAFLVMAAAASAEVVIKTEQLNPARRDWNFTTLPGPSKSDLAQGAKVTVAGNEFEPSAAGGAVLVNGRVPNDSLDLTEEALFSNANGNDGVITVDLGRVEPVAAVSSYSWHENPPDQGCRGPQIYTLSGSADGQGWTKLADVDTRPNTTGQKWNGQHGVFITDTTGKLGDFRYLSLAIQRTRSPLQGSASMTATIFSEIDVHSKDTLPRAGDVVVVPSTKVTDVWVVFKTHCDIGYTDTIEGVLRKFRENMMEIALRNIDADRALPPEKRFAWMLAGWPLKHVLGPQQDPARRARIEQAVREGALGIGAIPFSLETETVGLEDLVRGLGYASQIARQYGRPLPIAAKMTDVPCHSWAWPTVLRHAGVQFLQLGCNPNSGHLNVPPLFWWEGPDGSRILCNFTPEYGSGLIPPRNWPAANYLAMIMTGDNHGPPTQADVANIRRVAEERLPGIRVHLGTLDDFARALSAEKPDLPVVRGDMPDTWIHGFMSMPIETAISHAIRPFQPALDTLDTQLRAWGLSVDPVAPALADAYEQSNLYGEHTFGPAAPNMGSWNSRTPRDLYGEEWKAARARGAYTAYEQAFQGKRDFARKEVEIVNRELKSRLELLARSVDVAGPRVVVYNGLPWPRTGSVEVDGKTIYAENVPANGYRTYTTYATNSSHSSGSTLDTPFYRVTLDLKRGGISSLVEKKTGRELVDRASPYALGQFLHERFDLKRMQDWVVAYARPPVLPNPPFIKSTTPKDLVYAALTPPSWSAVIQRTDAADIATLTARDTLGLAKGMAIVITLSRHQPTVDVEWRVTEKTADPIPEGGWLCFPFAIERPQFKLGRLGGPIDPARDIVRGANKDLICLNSGLTISGPDRTGVGLCPVDSPCVSLGEPGLWKYTLDDGPRKPAVFVNLYNNEWHTNFPEWQDGSWTSRVRIWPTADLTVPSWEARLPLLATAADGPAGKLPETQAGLSVSRPGVLVTAFGQNPDGPGTVLRVWDQSGETGPLAVTIPGGFATATPVDLRGEKTGAPLPIKGDRLALQLGAYAPASFKLEN